MQLVDLLIIVILVYFDFDSIFQVLEFKKNHIIDWGFHFKYWALTFIWALETVYHSCFLSYINMIEIHKKPLYRIQGQQNNIAR